MESSSWREITLGEFVALQRGHDLTESERLPGSIPVMGSSGVNGYHNVSRMKGPGVTIGRSGVGSIGVVNYTPTNYWPHNTVLYVTDFQGNEPQFVYYFLQSLNLRTYDSGSAQSSLNRNYIYPIKIRVPLPSEQRAIARILGALDDKIELNRKMNATLEAMARAIFQSWFVDFDPVRAKAEGRAPAGMDAATAALFPDAFEEIDDRTVPRGWQIKPLGDFLNLKRGYDLPATSRISGTVPIISSSGISGWHNAAKVNGPGVVTGRYGTIGQVFFMAQNFWPLNTTLYVQDFKGNEPRVIYHLLENINFSVYVDKAAVPGINRNHVHQERITAPPKEIQRAFSRQAELLWQRHTSNLQEAATLMATRDTLLPRLLSGELRVREAEQIAEGVL